MNETKKRIRATRNAALWVVLATIVIAGILWMIVPNTDGRNVVYSVLLVPPVGGLLYVAGRSHQDLKELG
jgi:hypothetical protein